jgi:hypothetical protein
MHALILPATFTNQQNPHLQNGTKASMDVWTCNMGLHCSLQLSGYPAIPSEDSPTNHKRPMLCNKPYPTYKNQSVYAVSGTSRCLFSDKYKTFKDPVRTAL